MIGGNVPDVGIFLVTAAAASQMLLNVVDTGRVRQSTIDQMARDMTAGNFPEIGNKIRFDIYNRLLDGRHILHAIVKSGATLPLIVVTNLPVEAFDVIDTGRRRSAVDDLKMQGVPNAKTVAPALKLIVNVELDTIKFANQSPPIQLSIAETRMALDRHPDILSAVADTRDLRLGVNAGSLAAGVYLQRQIDRTRADDFLAGIVAGLNFGNGDPRAYFNTWRGTAKSKKAARVATETLHVYNVAWNAWVTEMPLHTVQITTPSTGAPMAFARPLAPKETT